MQATRILPMTIGVLATQYPTINTGFDKIPNFGAFANVISIKNGNWSDPTAWNVNRLPTTNDVVSVVHAINYDVSSNDSLDIVCVPSGGHLLYRPDITTKLVCNTLEVLEGGELQIGTTASPVSPNIKAELSIANTPIDTSNDPSQYGHGLLVLGKIRTCGAEKTPFVNVTTEPLVGNTALTLAFAPSGWLVGDKILVPDTRQLNENETWTNFVPKWETPTIQSINGNVITLASGLAYNHFAARNKDGVIEFYPHIANLTRNINIHSQSSTGVRGHTFYTRRADVDIRHTQFGGLGRTTKAALDSTTFDASGNVTHIGTNQIGRYPVHVHHMVGRAEVPSFTFIGNSVWCAMSPMPFKWGFTVHDSSYGLIKDNVVYNWAGAGFVTEEGSETENTFDHNFVCGIIGDDSPRNLKNLSGEGFSLWGSNHVLRNNIVTSCVGKSQGIVAGIGYNFMTNPLESPTTKVPKYPGADVLITGQYKLIDEQLIPISGFNNNQSYGCLGAGVVVWNLGAGGIYSKPIGQSVIANHLNWHTWEEFFYGYPCNNVLLLNCVDRGYRPELPIRASASINFGDYWTKKIIISNLNSQNRYFGIGQNSQGSGDFIVENSYFACYDAGVRHWTTATPGGPANGKYNRRLLWNNNIHVQLSGSPALKTIYMYYIKPPQMGSDFVKKNEVIVTNHNGVVGDNFQVYFLEQSGNFIMPQTTYYNSPPLVNINGSPVSGLTNQQNWDTYGIAIAGAVTPTYQTRPDIIGYVRNI